MSRIARGGGVGVAVGVLMLIATSCVQVPQTDTLVDLSAAAPFEHEAAVCATLAASEALRGDDQPFTSLRVVVEGAEQDVTEALEYAVSGHTTVTLAAGGDDNVHDYAWTCRATYSLDGTTAEANMTSFERVGSN